MPLPLEKGASSSSASEWAYRVYRANIPNQEENDMPQEEAVEGVDNEVDEGIGNDSQSIEEEYEPDTELERIGGETGEEGSEDWEVLFDLSMGGKEEPEEESKLCEIYDEEAEIIAINNNSWVEELWNKKEAVDAAEPKNTLQTEEAKMEEEESRELDFEMMDECLGSMAGSSQLKQPEENEPKSSDGGEMVATTAGQDDTEMEKAAVEPRQRTCNIPSAYFGPAVDESCFESCIQMYPVVHNDLVREDLASLLARAECVRLSQGSKTDITPRMLKIYCQSSSPLLCGLMFCTFSAGTVSVELIRKKPIGWKTTKLQGRVTKVPSVYSEECMKATFHLKTDYFRFYLGDNNKGNIDQEEKERSLYITNIPANVDQIIMKHMFPLATKITWVNDTENLRSVVLLMTSRRMVLDHMMAMTGITINGQQLKIGALGLSQQDAEKELSEKIKENVGRGWNSSKPRMMEKKKDSTEIGESRGSSETLTKRTDDVSSNKKSEPGLLGESPLKAEAGTGQSQKPSPKALKKLEKEEREQKLREAGEERLEREKRDQKWRESGQRGQESGRQNMLKRKLEEDTGEESREPSQGEPSRPDFKRGPENPQEEKQEELRGKQRVRMHPSGGSPQHQESHMQHEMEMDMQQNMEIQREMGLQKERELEKQKERELEKQKERELEKQRERELEKQRERELEKQKERELEKQKERELEKQRERELEKQRERELEKQRERELESQREREWEKQREREWENQRKREWREWEKYGESGLEEQRVRELREWDKQREGGLEEQRVRRLREWDKQREGGLEEQRVRRLREWDKQREGGLEEQRVRRLREWDKQREGGLEEQREGGLEEQRVRRLREWDKQREGGLEEQREGGLEEQRVRRLREWDKQREGGLEEQREGGLEEQRVRRLREWDKQREGGLEEQRVRRLREWDKQREGGLEEQREGGLEEQRVRRLREWDKQREGGLEEQRVRRLREWDKQREREWEKQRERELEKQRDSEMEEQCEWEWENQRDWVRDKHISKEREKQREWEHQRKRQDKERKEMEHRKKGEHNRQENERKWQHQEELLREKERLERKHQETKQEKQRREREERQPGKPEMEVEGACMQQPQQLEEERQCQQQERKELERASTSRKRTRFEEPEDREHGMAASKRGRGDDGPWDNSTEVVQQAEPKNNLDMLDEDSPGPSGLNEVQSRTEKVHGGHHTGPSTAFDRAQKPDYREGYGHDSQSQYQQPYDQDYDMEFQDYEENMSHFQHPGEGDGLVSATVGKSDYKNSKLLLLGAQDPASWQQINPLAQGAGASGYGGQQEGGGGGSYQHQGEAQHTGGSRYGNQGWGAGRQGSVIQGLQRREQGRGGNFDVRAELFGEASEYCQGGSTTRLFVGNLSEGVRISFIRTLFEKYGQVDKIDLLKNYGFVRMPNVSEANAAIDALDGYNINGQRITVDVSLKGRGYLTRYRRGYKNSDDGPSGSQGSRYNYY